MNEPAHKTLARLDEFIRGAKGDYIALRPYDALFLLTRCQEQHRMIRAQQNVVDDTARYWREIGYEDGYSTGYDEALNSA